MQNDIDPMKPQIIVECENLMKKTECVRSELFNLYQMEFSLLVGIAIGVSGGILGNFIYNIFDKSSKIYWGVFTLLFIIFLLLICKVYQKIKYLNKLYRENDIIYKSLIEIKKE